MTEEPGQPGTEDPAAPVPPVAPPPPDGYQPDPGAPTEHHHPAPPPPPFPFELSGTPAPDVQDVPRRSRRGRVIGAAVVALTLFAAGIGTEWVVTHDWTREPSIAVKPPPSESPITPVPGSPPSGGTAEGLDAGSIADKVNPAVVAINVVVDENPFDELPATGGGAGTGMIVSSWGAILTNNHVIEGASKIEVSVFGRSRSYTAQVLGADPTDDVALLQIQAGSDLPTVAFADSSTVAPGQPIVVIGNALGRGTSTVVEGTVSAVGRSITVSDGSGGTERLTDVIQVDATIQPGESGGPLLNSQGRVIGVITAGSRGSRFETPAGGSVGFAISSNKALSIVNDIRAGRASSSIIIGQPGYLGIGAQDLDQETAARLDLGVTTGVLVVGVVPNGPAEGAGIARNAVITAFDGLEVTSADELGAAIRQHKPGDRVTVTWVDGSGTHTATVELSTGPAV